MIDLSKPYLENITLIYEPTGEKFHFSYRLPTTSEMRAYMNEFARTSTEPDKVSEDFPINHVSPILVSIGENEWGADGKAISSDPKSPDYASDWKEQVLKNDLARTFVSRIAGIAFLCVSGEKKVPFSTN